MVSAPDERPAKRSVGIILLFLAFLVLAASRRWHQLVSPQVWAEDGMLIRSFAEIGWAGLAQPLNGYLVLMPRIVTGASLLISSYYYPMVSTILAFLLAGLVGVSVAISPTRLRGKILCAASVFLVPSDAEVFGLPLYTLWWAPIPLLLVALWDENDRSLFLRLLYLAVGGLSSPYIFVVLPLLCLRAVMFRKLRREIAVAGAAALVAAIQVWFVLGGAHMARPPGGAFAQYVVPRFCGWFLAGGITENGFVLWPAGILMLALVGAYLCANRRDAFAWILFLLYIGSVASSLLRNNPAALHPFRGGPRYFFFPFFLMSWILIQLAYTANWKWLRNLAAAAAVVGALNAIPQWTRAHDDLHWGEHLLSSRLFSEYDIPIESEGHWFREWTVGAPGTTWSRLLRSDRLLSAADQDARPTFAYRIVGADELSSTWDSGEAPKGGPAVSIRAAGGKKDTLLRLSTSRRIRFRSGQVTGFQTMEIAGHEGMFIPRLPQTTDWVTLEFSNAKLPEVFTVRVIDRGQGVGEWAEVGIP